MEVWDAYSKDREILPGLALERSAFPYKEGYYHLAVNVWIQDEAGNWLFVKRSMDKEHFPNIYELGAGGSVLQGETAADASQREVLEETGLTALNLAFLFSFTEDKYQTHFDTFLMTVKGIEPHLIYQKGETQEHVWIPKDAVEVFLETHAVFENQKKQLLDYLFG